MFQMSHTARLVITVVALSMAAFAQTPSAPAPVPATQSAIDEEARIRATVLDYIEGFYEGRADRMERALHPDLAKRIVKTDEKGRSNLGQMSAMTLVQIVRTGAGTKTPKEQQRKDITILDRYNDMAVAKLIAADFVDYLELAKWNGEWKIVNALWTTKPR